MLIHHLHNRPNLRTGGGMSATPWLFPGYRPGKHPDVQSITIRLRWLGINLLGARNSALGNPVAEIPLPWSPNSSDTATKSPSGTPNSPPNHGRVTSHSDSPAANIHVVLPPTDEYDKIEYAASPVRRIFACSIVYFGRTSSLHVPWTDRSVRVQLITGPDRPLHYSPANQLRRNRIWSFTGAREIIYAPMVFNRQDRACNMPIWAPVSAAREN